MPKRNTFQEIELTMKSIFDRLEVYKNLLAEEQRQNRLLLKTAFLNLYTVVKYLIHDICNDLNIEVEAEKDTSWKVQKIEYFLIVNY